VALLAGIDEAGYGPILGPLVVSAVTFRVRDGQLQTCLWKTLRESCAPRSKPGDRRLPVADSKKLFNPRHGMARLERTALVMLAVAGKRPKTWRSLLDQLSPDGDSLPDCPWYNGPDVVLPLSDAVGDVCTRANAVRIDCAARGVALVGVQSEPVLEDRFNRLVASTRSKGVVLLGIVMRMIYRILKTNPDDRVRICVDRLGGRSHYRESLSLALPGCELQILEESDRRSTYRLTHGRRVCRVEFVTNGETHHFPIALASIFSKYVRELYMHAFNRYWRERKRDLKPTAGYYTDALRWLEDVAPTLDSLGVDRASLVRQR